MNPICFYHKADLDGVCSGAIVKKFVPDCELYGIDYGDEFPWHLIKTPYKGFAVVDPAKRTVYMVDFSLPPEDMKKLAECSDLIWIDHHKTAIDAYMADVGDTRESLLRTDFAACELVWAWCTAETRGQFKVYTYSSAPEAVRLLGRYDVWDKDNPEWNTKILPFQYGCRAIEGVYDPLCSQWADLFEADESSDYIELPWLSDISATGSSILRFQAQQNAQIAKAGAFEAHMFDAVTITTDWTKYGKIPGGSEFGKHVRCICLNTPVFNSKSFEAVYDPEKHDVMVPFAMMANGKWKVSLYSTKPELDCGAIAKTFGGGGHKGAAGFVCDELPWRTT